MSATIAVKLDLGCFVCAPGLTVHVVLNTVFGGEGTESGSARIVPDSLTKEIN